MNYTTSEPTPHPLVVASRLLWASAAMTVLVVVVVYSGLIDYEPPGGRLGRIVVHASLIMLCAAKLTTPRRWPRWLMLALFALGPLMLPFAFAYDPAEIAALPTIIVLELVLQLIVQAAALSFAFMPSASAWLRGIHA